MRLAIITTHPIQYCAPVFKLLTERGRLDVRVFYTWEGGKGEKADPGFGHAISWDVPLLDGYAHEFVPNTSRDPGSHHFGGAVNPALIATVRAFRPDAVLVYGWAYQSHLQAMRWFHGRVPVWFRGDSTLLDERPGARTLARRLALRWIYRHIDGAFYTGTQNRAYFEAHGVKQLVWAPHAIDNERFGGADATSHELRARAWRGELGLSPERTTLVYSGKFEPKKAPLFLVRAVQQHNRTSNRPVSLVLVGNGVLLPELTALAVGDPLIRILPFQNQQAMPAVYRLGDVLVLPSQGPGESWGLVVNEAMASSRPVLVSDRCGCAVDLVRPSVTGAVFQAGNPRDFQNKLNELLKSDLPAMGEMARDHVARWSMEAQCIAYESTLTANRPAAAIDLHT